MTTPPSRTGPLTGVRVVEIAGIGPGPFAATLLADLGADVIRVDRPGGPGLAATAPDEDLLTRGRPSVAVDLRHPQGAQVVLDLVEHADLLLEGYRPGVAERLGIGPDACLARNPALVYGRMTGWGQDGPFAQSAGHDLNYIALSGALHLSGRRDGPPQFPANLLGDFGGGSLYLVVGLLAGLLEARSSGQGQVVDAAIVDGTAHLTTLLVAMANSGLWKHDRGTNLLDSGAPFYDVYETSDGEWMSLGALEPQFWDIFVERFGADLPDRDDPAHWGELREAIAARFAERTQQEWRETYDGTDACVAPVLSWSDGAEHPHLAARGTYVEHEGRFQPAPAPRFSRTPAQLSTPPTRAGQDSRIALQAWGITDVDHLIEKGVVSE